MPYYAQCGELCEQSDIGLIPGGLTGKIQPADVSWNKPFKTAYKQS